MGEKRDINPGRKPENKGDVPMNKCLFLLVPVCVVLLAAQRSAHGVVITRELKGDDVGYASYWPEGLREVVSVQPRVAGHVFDAPTFLHGMITVNLCFAGDREKFNTFLAGFAKVKHKELILHLAPGKGVYEKKPRPPLKVKTPIAFDWRVRVFTDGLVPRADAGEKFADGPITRVSVKYYLGDRGHLTGLDVPPNIAVRAGFDGKFRQAHKDDPTVQAIDTFVARRRKTQKSSSKARTP